MSDNAEVKRIYSKLQVEIIDAEETLEVLRLKVKINQRRCSHPNQYSHSAMGEMGVKCPDCGYQT